MSQSWGDLVAAGVSGTVQLVGLAGRGAGALVSGEVELADIPATVGRGFGQMSTDTATGTVAVGRTVGAELDAIPERVAAVVGAVPELVGATSRAVVGLAVIAVVGGVLYLRGR